MGRDSNKRSPASQTDVSVIRMKKDLYLHPALVKDRTLQSLPDWFRVPDAGSMTPRAWRQAGYRTMIRDGIAYLYRPATEEVIAASLHQGPWPATDNLGSAPWTRWSRADDAAHPGLLEDFRATAATCYCDQGTVAMCDYCAGLHRSPWLSSE